MFVFLRELNKLLKPDKQRASELREEFQKGFDGIAKRIWPHLTYVHGVVSGKVYHTLINVCSDTVLDKLEPVGPCRHHYVTSIY